MPNEMVEMLEKIVHSRHAVRGFLPAPVDGGTIRKALTIAGRTPSNCNVQPWLVHLVEGDALDSLRHALIEAASSGTAPDDDFGSTTAYPGVYRTRQVDTAQQLYGALGIERHDAAGRRSASLRNFAMFDAPHVALLFVPDWAGPRELADAGAWAQTFMLALTALGIGSIPQAALGLYPGVARAELGMPATQLLLYGISFGHADPHAPANGYTTARAPLEEMVTLHR